MVVFTCKHCGESVKKPSVVKHYQTKCRKHSKFVSCMICQKDFREEEYNSHTSCGTEAAKYSGKGYVPKPSANASLKKQESWLEIVRSILNSTDAKPEVRRIFQRCTMHNNLPRKKDKFIKFLWNSFKVHPGQAQPVWQVFEVALDKLRIAQQQAAAPKTKSKKQPKKEDQNEIQKSGTVNEANRTAENGENGIVKKERCGEPSAEEVSPPKQVKEEPSAEKVSPPKQIKKEPSAEEIPATKQIKEEPSAEEIPSTKQRNEEQYANKTPSKKKRDEDRSAEDATPKNKKFKHTDEITNGDAEKENELVPEVANPEKNQLAKTDAHVEKNEVIKFDWSNEIYSIVEENDKQISLDDLKKIVFEKYRSICTVDKISWKVKKTFSKKLRNCGLLIEDNMVKMTI